jgi:hypothetical protein
MGLKIRILAAVPKWFLHVTPLLALKIRILAAVPKCFLHFKLLADTRNSHSRCGSQVFSPFQAPLLALKIRILAAVPKWFLHFKPFAGTQNSHSRCGSQVVSAFQALCWHSKFAFPLWLRSEFCISSPLLALTIRIPAAVP